MAVEDANYNAERNNITNCNFISGTVERVSYYIQLRVIAHQINHGGDHLHAANININQHPSTDTATAQPSGHNIRNSVGLAASANKTHATNVYMLFLRNCRHYYQPGCCSFVMQLVADRTSVSPKSFLAHELSAANVSQGPPFSLNDLSRVSLTVKCYSQRRYFYFLSSCLLNYVGN